MLRIAHLKAVVGSPCRPEPRVEQSKEGNCPMKGGPSIKHLDDVPAEEMLRYEFADGRTASIWEKWIELSPRYFAFWNKWDPGAISSQHGHTGDHSNFILAGEIRCGDVVARAGTHIMLEWGDVFDLGRPALRDANCTGSSPVRDNRSAVIPPPTKRCSRRVVPDRYPYRCQNACRRGYLPN